MIAALWAEELRQNQESPSRWLHQQSIHLQCRKLPAIQETQVWPLGLEVPLEKEMAAHSSVLAWRIPGTEEPGGPQFIESQTVRHTEWLNHMNHKNKWLSPNPLLCSHFSLENFESRCKYKVPRTKKNVNSSPLHHFAQSNGKRPPSYTSCTANPPAYEMLVGFSFVDQLNVGEQVLKNSNFGFRIWICGPSLLW